jgi:hypothetical protein
MGREMYDRSTNVISGALAPCTTHYGFASKGDYSDEFSVCKPQASILSDSGRSCNDNSRIGNGESV